MQNNWEQDFANLTRGTYSFKTQNQMSGHMPALPENPQVAMAYVPYQNMQDTFTPEEALKRGTLFPELDKPFLGERGFSQ